MSRGFTAIFDRRLIAPTDEDGGLSEIETRLGQARSPTTANGKLCGSETQERNALPYLYEFEQRAIRDNRPYL